MLPTNAPDMFMIQMCGLSGSGKTTLALGLQKALQERGVPVEVIDGDEYRTGLCPDLGFSPADRQANIRRLAFVGSRFRAHGILPVIAAINPYEDIRREIGERYAPTLLVWVKCSLPRLMERDTKGLYQRALLPDDHPQKIRNLTGVNDPFQPPVQPDLIIDTSDGNEAASGEELFRFIWQQLEAQKAAHAQ